MIATDLTRLLSIEHPVMSAGMARVAQADLVVAVSEAGGLGCLGGISYLPDPLRAEIRAIRARTSKPFAVNLLLPDVLTSADEEQWEPVRQLWEDLTPEQRGKMTGIEPLLTAGAVVGQADVVIDERPPVVVLTFATPPAFIQRCHDDGIIVGALVGSIGRAAQAARDGVDFVIAQGSEGGGHTGHIGTMVLTPSVVDIVPVPVAAAGGITDGRGLAASLALGAQAVWVGTRFIATHEAFGHPAIKQRIVEGHSRDTTLTKSYTGKPLRAFRNSWTSKWENRADQINAFPAQYAVAGPRVETAYQEGDLTWGMLPAGQGTETVYEITPARKVVHDMVSEAEAILSRLTREIAATTPNS